MARRRVPILSTIVVLAAVATMISLGVWQLHRKQWKEALLARYEAAAKSGDIVGRDFADPANAFHRAAFSCDQGSGWASVAGRNAADEPGWAHTAQCRVGGLEPAEVVLGWSREPSLVNWTGGEVEGTIVPGGRLGAHIVADPPLAGLEANARPDPTNVATTPMGHLSYALQWFAFAAIALVIYGLALRKRWREEVAAGQGAD